MSLYSRGIESLLLIRSLLPLVEARHVPLIKRDLMEPVIADPAIDHRIHRHQDFQCRTPIHQRYQRFKAVVASPCDSGCNVHTSMVLRQQMSQQAQVARNDLYR